ncbi:hypothetical protein CDAR_41191 [Caerostris darwini]|uniref:Uncharacterized protein n=1 Tax=Caerostris darwini TaxID=1538125 RepID=A0AAV4SLL3_9ARAC|nr:hypothetical protein CDAR_41191 [Caerostris darwini]
MATGRKQFVKEEILGSLDSNSRWSGYLNFGDITARGICDAFIARWYLHLREETGPDSCKVIEGENMATGRKQFVKEEIRGSLDSNSRWSGYLNFGDIPARGICDTLISRWLFYLREETGVRISRDVEEFFCNECHLGSEFLV